MKSSILPHSLKRGDAASAMIARKIGPAFAAGCTVVVKVGRFLDQLRSWSDKCDLLLQPPAETPFTALALAEVGFVICLGSDCYCSSLLP